MPQPNITLPRRTVAAAVAAALAATALPQTTPGTRAQRHRDLLDTLAATEEAQIVQARALLAAFDESAFSAAGLASDARALVQAMLDADIAHLESLFAMGAVGSPSPEPAASTDVAGALLLMAELKQHATAAYAGATESIRLRRDQRELLGIFGVEARSAATTAMLAGQPPIASPWQAISPPESAWSAMLALLQGAPEVTPLEEDDAQAPVLDAIAAELGVAVETLDVISVEPRDWPDTSLGCPRPGEAYADVITPGHLVVVEANGERIEFHTDLRGNVERCP